MNWISVEVDTPNIEVFKGKKILVLVNGQPFLCTVIEEGCIYLTHDYFIYTQKDGWCGDHRFAKPTHWMPIPELYEE